MTPKEKAEQLIKKHLTAIAKETMDSNNIIIYNAKQCALITVNEIIDSIEIGFEDYKSLKKNSYYEEVKRELTNL